VFCTSQEIGLTLLRPGYSVRIRCSNKPELVQTSYEMVFVLTIISVIEFLMVPPLS